MSCVRSDALRLFFFFQAEDGIRDLTVTGVQTCALPILGRSAFSYAAPSRPYVCARKYLSALGADRWSTSIACWVWPCASRACASRMLASWAPWVPEKFSTTWDSTLAASG